MSQPQAKETIQRIRPYVAGKSGSKQQQVIKLSSNENPFGPSPKVAQAMASVANNMHRYPDSGHQSLRTAIAEVEGLPASQLICGAGSDELIGMLVQAYTDQGDEVLYPEHGFLMYKIYALANGAKPRTAAEENLTTHVNSLLEAVTEKTKIVFFANPNNPTGSYLPASEVKRLRDGLPEHVILAIDGAYAEYMQEDDYTDGRELVEAGENTIMLRTFSKGYGIPALRVGWAYAPESMIDILNRVRGPFNVNAVALAAAEAAMRDQDYLRKMVEINAQERERLTQALQDKLTIHPAYGNFLLLGMGDPATATAANNHLNEHNIIVREVAAYGLPDCLRVSVGTPEENDVFLKAMESFIR